MESVGNVVMADSLDGLGKGGLAGHLAHAVCLAGRCTFDFNGRSFEMRRGCLMIVRKGKLVERIRASEDFRVRVLYVAPAFVEMCTPKTNYGMRGSVSLFSNPVMRLTEEQYRLCRRGFEWVAFRLRQTGGKFYKESLGNAVQSAILDFFEFHAHTRGGAPVPTQGAMVMEKFMRMLDSGDYRRNRALGYYAGAICVTPKYLSEVSRKVSGYSANYWINRYTILDISRRLRDRRLSFAHISDMFRFSSPAYFSRYVQRHLGMTPTDYRGDA